MKSVGKERRCFSSIISATAVLLFFREMFDVDCTGTWRWKEENEIGPFSQPAIDFYSRSLVNHFGPESKRKETIILTLFRVKRKHQTRHTST